MVGGSIYVLAHDMQAHYKKKHEVDLINAKGSPHKPYDLVINLVPKCAAGLMNSKRYMPFGKIVHVFTPNAEEFTSWELAGMLAVTGKDCYWVAHSPYNARNIRRLMKAMFSPAYVRTFEERFWDIPCGIKAEDFVNGKKDPDLLIAPFNRLSAAQKNIKLHSEITRKFLIASKVRNRNPRVELYLCEAFDKKHSLDLEPYVVQKQPEDRKAYLERAGKCSLFLCTSGWESFGLYYLELLAAGAVGVFLERMWAKDLLGDYPLIVPKERLLETLMWSYEHREEAVKLIAPAVSRLKKQYALSRFCDVILEIK